MGHSSLTNPMRDVRGQKVGPGTIDKDGIEGGGRAWRRLMAEVEHACDEAEDGAERRVARTRVSNSFSTDAVLLRRECQCGKRGGQQFRERASENVEFPHANPKAHILEAEEIIAGVAGCARVFAGPQKEVEPDYQAVGRTERDCSSRRARDANGSVHELQGKRLDPGRWGIRLFPCV